MEEELLQEIVKYYNEKLAGKTFEIIASRKNQTMKITVKFTSSNFKHLAGFQHLSDMSVKDIPSKTLISNIKQGKVKYENIKQSQDFSLIKLRLEDFQKMDKVLDKNSNMVESNSGFFNQIKADFVIYKNVGDSNVAISYLFVRNDFEKGLYVPVSYVVSSADAFINKYSKYWKILSVEEVKEYEKHNNLEKEKIFSNENINGQDKDKEEIKVLVKEPGLESQEIKIHNVLQEFQKKVNGYIETIPFPGKEDCMDMVINDEAKLLKLDKNISVPEYKDIVSGTIIVAGLNNDGSFRSLTDDEVKYANDYFKEHEYTVEQQKDSKEYDRERDD